MDETDRYVVLVHVLDADGGLVGRIQLRWEAVPVPAVVVAELCSRALAARRNGQMLAVVAPPPLVCLLHAAGLLAPSGPFLA